MKKTTVTVEASKTKNYQKYTVALQCEVEYSTMADLDAIITQLQAMCRSKVLAQIGLDDKPQSVKVSAV